MFVFGTILGLPGTVLGLPEVADAYGLSLADRGTLISTLFVGLLLGSIASGPLVDRFGHRTSLAASSALVAVSLLLFAAASTFSRAGVALLCLGVSCAGMNTASNALGSELFPGERGRRMNGIALMVGLGGLAMPLATALVSGMFSWRAIVVGGAVLAAAATASAALVDVAGSAPVTRRSTDAVAYIARQPAFGWFGLLLVLGAATEASMAGWTSTFLAASGFSARAATWALSTHWLGLIVGRVLFMKRVDISKGAAIRRAALCGAAAVGVFLAVQSPLVLAAGPFVVGLAIAVVVPTSLAWAGDRYPGNAGALFGMLLTLAQVGGIAAPALIGVVADWAGVRIGLTLVVANCLLVAFVAHRGAASDQSV